jgi:dephospho-CoA kinase
MTCAKFWRKNSKPVARPFIIGLTGAMGMGKSETARLFAAEGVPVFDADAAVHTLYAAPGTLGEKVESRFPGTVTTSGIDRAALSAQLARAPQNLAALEAIIHPALEAARDGFMEVHKSSPLVLFDVPLLLEIGLAVDALVVASAPSQVQRARVLARPGMTEEKFTALSARQWSDDEKRAQAHYIVTTDKGLDHAREQVKMILAELRKKLDHA